MLKFIEYVQFSKVFRKARSNDVLQYLAKDTGQRNGPIVRGVGFVPFFENGGHICLFPYVREFSIIQRFRVKTKHRVRANHSRWKPNQASIGYMMVLLVIKLLIDSWAG